MNNRLRAFLFILLCAAVLAGLCGCGSYDAHTPAELTPSGDIVSAPVPELSHNADNTAAPTEPAPAEDNTPDPALEFRLTVLHTNDLHGRLENVPQYATIVAQVRAEGGNVLLLDGGDLFRRGPYAVFYGAVETEIFNAMRYDAIVFGNGDFPANDKELYDLSEHTILKMANFPVLCANITIDGRYVGGFTPYIIKEMQGVSVAVIGVTSQKPRDRKTDLSKRVLFEDPVLTLDNMLAEVEGGSDIQIVLSHAGFTADVTMRGVSAIIGADSHIKFTAPFVVTDGDTEIPLAEAGGENDNYLGRLDLVYQKIDGRWVLTEFSGSLFTLDGIAPDKDIQDIIAKYDDLLASDAA